MARGRFDSRQPGGGCLPLTPQFGRQRGATGESLTGEPRQGVRVKLQYDPGMRHTSKNRNNRMRLQKIGKKLRQQAKQKKKEQKQAAKAAAA